MKTITKQMIRNCVFGVKCDKKWKSMEYVGEDSFDNEISFCSECEKEVYATYTKDDLFRNVEMNRCVAILTEEVTTIGDIAFTPPRDEF